MNLIIVVYAIIDNFVVKINKIIAITTRFSLLCDNFSYLIYLR